MQLLEIDSNVLFKILVDKLKGQDRKDYLERVFTKIGSDIKIPGRSKVILQNVSEILETSDLQDGQRIVIELIKELFEPSRDENDIRIGMNLMKKLRGENLNCNFFSYGI